ncbi:MAG: succinyldiaminopimelate transaminase [Gammaproteobacteria bacterium]|nr:succinyldiaminopimelate transaminase [Gammaproteobacteria bacterium]
MNPHLDRLQPYPFERLDALLEGLSPNRSRQPVALSLGEPKHDAPDFVVAALAATDTIERGLATYPPTRGSDSLRTAISRWIRCRFGADLDPATEVLPVNGTREALFSFGQAVLSGKPGATVLMPNPFYQIYEGAALLRGATPYYVPATGLPDFDALPDSIWPSVELAYVCNPGNPSGQVIPEPTLAGLIRRAREFDFVIASDECYSEIYRDEDDPPTGLLQAAANAGLGHRNCVVFNSLSKRSNVPGLRSGFVAGDPDIIARYYDYRTYHGCAMSAHVAAVSELAWSDEAHVVANRALYRAKFDAVFPVLREALDVTMPPAAFYLWPKTPVGDEAFAAALYRHENITVLPGSYLGRTQDGVNPGEDRVRVALVAPLANCVAAARRLADFVETHDFG